jgi:hypothetical protein
MFKHALPGGREADEVVHRFALDPAPGRIDMRIRMAIASAAAALIGVVAAPAVALAGPTDNESASVAGVASVPAGACPSGYFCLYTRTGLTGRMFKLYYCQYYAMSNWNGTGSARNNQIGADAVAYLFGQDKRTAYSRIPVGYQSNQDFRPVWYAKPC